jgi:hypothetical protein
VSCLPRADVNVAEKQGGKGRTVPAPLEIGTTVPCQDPGAQGCELAHSLLT